MGLAMKRHTHLFYGLFCVLLCLQICKSEKMTIDLEGTDCSRVEPIYVTDTDLVSVIARPRVDVPSRTLCVIRLKAPTYRWFNIYLHDIYFTDCGVTLKFFDRDLHLRNTFKSFGCQSSPGATFRTSANDLIIQLSKLSSASRRYRIRIELATNEGPRLGIDVDPNKTAKYQSSTLMTLYAVVLIFLLV